MSAIQEAIDNLKSVLCDPDGNVCIAGSDADKVIVQKALALLEQSQPEPGEFTKENREFIRDADRDFQAGRVKGDCIPDYVRALKELGQACDRLDAKDKEIKRLVEERGKAQNGTHKALVEIDRLKSEIRVLVKEGSEDRRIISRKLNLKGVFGEETAPIVFIIAEIDRLKQELAEAQKQPEANTNFYQSIHCVRCGKTASHFIQTQWPGFTCKDCFDKQPEAGDFTARIRKKYALGATVEKQTPGHGPCCTCQECGFDLDNCRCQENDFIEACDHIDRLKAENKAQVEKIAGIKNLNDELAERVIGLRTEAKAQAEELSLYRSQFCEAHQPNEKGGKVCPCCEAVHQAERTNKADNQGV